MSTGLDMRGTGRTTDQMRAAPSGAMYVWVNSHLEYPRDLARSIGRTDLIIVRPSKFLDASAVFGLRVPAVIVDHAVHFTDREYVGFEKAREILLRRGGK